MNTKPAQFALLSAALFNLMEDSQEHTVAIAEFHTAAGERCQLQLTATRVPEHLMPVHPMHICAEK